MDRLGHSDAGRDGRGPAFRRKRILARDRNRTPHARRKGRSDLRGDQPDPQVDRRRRASATNGFRAWRLTVPDRAATGAAGRPAGRNADSLGAFAAEPPRERPDSPPASYGVPRRGGRFVEWSHVIGRLGSADAYWLGT